MSMRRGYYRIPNNNPANRIAGPLSDAVLAKFKEGWSKARIAREFRLNRRTVIRICASLNRPSELPTPNLESANWLPAPTGPFMMYLRLYWPKDAALDGQWTAPKVDRVQ
jgi:hypothetical protein